MTLDPQNRPGQAGHNPFALSQEVQDIADRVADIENGNGGAGDPTAAQVNLRWRNDVDGEYFGHGDSLTAAFGDMIMYDPIKSAPSGIVTDSQLDVTLPGITSDDYGKRIQVSCQFDSDIGAGVADGGDNDGISGTVTFFPSNNDIIGDTDDAVAAYGPGYVEWTAGLLNETIRTTTRNKQGPYVATLIALPPDDTAVEATGRWMASISTFAMPEKAANELDTVAVAPSGTHNAVAGQRVILDGAGGASSATVNLPANPQNGEVIEIWIINGGGTSSVTIGRNGQNINTQAANGTLTDAGTGALQVAKARCEVISALFTGWVVSSFAGT